MGYYIIVPFEHIESLDWAREVLKGEEVIISLEDFNIFNCEGVISFFDNVNVLNDEAYCFLYSFKSRRELGRNLHEIVNSRKEIDDYDFGWQVDIAKADEVEVNKLKERSRKLLILERL